MSVGACRSLSVGNAPSRGEGGNKRKRAPKEDKARGRRKRYSLLEWRFERPKRVKSGKFPPTVPLPKGIPANSLAARSGYAIFSHLSPCPRPSRGGGFAFYTFAQCFAGVGCKRRPLQRSKGLFRQRRCEPAFRRSPNSGGAIQIARGEAEYLLAAGSGGQEHTLFLSTSPVGGSPSSREGAGGGRLK